MPLGRGAGWTGDVALMPLMMALRALIECAGMFPDGVHSTEGRFDPRVSEWARKKPSSRSVCDSGPGLPRILT